MKSMIENVLRAWAAFVDALRRLWDTLRGARSSQGADTLRTEFPDTVPTLREDADPPAKV